MTMGRIIFTLIGCLILAVITGIVTRNILVAVAFPFLLVVFLLMWRNIKERIPEEEDKGEDIAQEGIADQNVAEQPVQESTEYPPVSTNYPRRPE
jgi:choline-glycine betaine transporter